METWRLIEEGRREGHWNMATDRAILAACGEGKAPPTLRLYGWERPTLTVGYSQNPFRDVDQDRCRLLGIPVICRPTGGRALLHDRELTYSLVAPIPHPRFPSGLRESCRVVSEAILASLKQLGIWNAVMAGGRHASPSSQPIRSPACFSSLNHYEIAVDHKKLVGSAQRRNRRSFLQHGSLLIDCDRERMNSLFLFQGDPHRGKSLEVLKRRVTTLHELCGEEAGFEEAARAFRIGFQEAFPANWETGSLTSYESKLRDQYLKQGNSSKGWPP
ncbi:MAG: biotin/lipoate A/B protein ligase family protein [Nitrospinaceae bacterium]